MWREPEAMRALPWSRRLWLRLGWQPRTTAEAGALGTYVDWLSGPRLLLQPALVGLGVLLGGLVTQPLLVALAMGAVAFVAALGLALVTHLQARKNSGDRPVGLRVRQATAAGLSILVVGGLTVGAVWMTQQVTVLVSGEDLLQVVSDVDEQWWGRVNTVVVADSEQVPTALEQDAPDVLLLTDASEPVAEDVGPGTVVAHRQDDPSVVVTVHLTNGEGATWAFVQELITWPGPGPDAFQRAGFTHSP